MNHMLLILSQYLPSADPAAEEMLTGLLGLAVGDALGLPVQFSPRGQLNARPQGPVTGMEGMGVFSLPAGSWSDDTSMALATAESLTRLGYADPEDIMRGFTRWLTHGEFTPFGYAFDVGGTCGRAINRYRTNVPLADCGLRGEQNNGNRSLMRILPACLFAHRQRSLGLIDQQEALSVILSIGGLTHAHPRAQLGCLLYFLMVCHILDDRDASLQDALQAAMNEALELLADPMGVLQDAGLAPQLSAYARLFDLSALAALPREAIRSTGYVVDTLEAAVWCLLTEKALPDALLKAVNLGWDTDTVGAVCGGLGVLHHGRSALPAAWIDELRSPELFLRACSLQA